MRERGSERDRRRSVPPPVPAGVSPAAVSAVHVVTRAVFAARTPRQIVELVAGAVRELGGDVVPAHANPGHALPIDLGG